MSTILNKQQLEAAIKSIQTRGAKLDADIQTAAVSSLAHYAQHGDIVFVNRLYLAMPNGSRRSSLALWFMTFGKIAANTDAGTKAEVPFVTTKEGANDVAGAEAVLWHAMKKDQAPDEVFDIKKAVAAILAKASKSPTVNDPELLKALKALAPVKAK